MADWSSISDKELLDLFYHAELQKHNHEIFGEEGNSSVPYSEDYLVETADSEGMCDVMDVM